jgi:threonylcarbamoyladenosine tRNA methylthiotransferase MtaB
MKDLRKRNLTSRADIYVINTCSVTENADKECRYLVRSIQRKSPESLVVITGCYAQLKPKEIAEIPGCKPGVGRRRKIQYCTTYPATGKGRFGKDLQLRYRRSFRLFTLLTL